MTQIGNMRISFSKKFTKLYDNSPDKIQQAFDSRLKIFIKGKYLPILNNHPLKGKLAGYRSINVTGDWRAVFREFENGDLVYFEVLGTHSQLYK